MANRSLIFSWRPVIAQSPSTNAINLQVTDNGTPQMSATQTLIVTVQLPQTPALNAASISNGLFSFMINGDVGPEYVVETSSNLANGSVWTPVATNLSANPPFTWTNPAGTGAGQKIYRVQLDPLNRNQGSNDGAGVASV